MSFSFPTPPNLFVSQKWGNVNAALYPAPTYRHMGLDIAGPVGAPIYAAADGVVADVSLYSQHGYGRFVVIQHEDGAYDTLYAHLHKIDVLIGDEVVGGQKIGEMGGDPKDNDPIDGASSGPHLHFEVVLANQPSGDFVKTWKGYSVDPLPFLAERAFGKPGLTGVVKSVIGVRIRTATNVDALVIGGASKNETLKIMQLVDVGTDQWARLWSLRPEFAAVRYRGDQLIDVGVATLPSNPPTAPTLDERAIRLDEVSRMIAYLEKRKSEL